MSQSTNTETTTPLSLRIERVLPATPDEVFDAYTDAEKQRIWFSILDEEPGYVDIEVDLRVGGTQTAVWGPNADYLFRETQTFLEIDRPRRLVTESTGSTPEGMTMTTHVVVTFEPSGENSTLMTVEQSGFPAPEIRDYFLTEPWNGAFDRIAAYLERR